MTENQLIIETENHLSFICVYSSNCLLGNRMLRGKFCSKGMMVWNPWQGWGTAQCVECLLCKHEDLSWIPGTHRQKQAWQQTLVIPIWGRGDRRSQELLGYQSCQIGKILSQKCKCSDVYPGTPPSFPPSFSLSLPPSSHFSLSPSLPLPTFSLLPIPSPVSAQAQQFLMESLAMPQSLVSVFLFLVSVCISWLCYTSTPMNDVWFPFSFLFIYYAAIITVLIKF